MSTPTYKLYQRVAHLPLGKRFFSHFVSAWAPYFGSISPQTIELRPGYAEVSIKKRKSVTNHIGTVHAIACCNLAEFAMGMVMEASIPDSMRWIPKGMRVDYRAKAGTDLVAKTSVAPMKEGESYVLPVYIEIFDKAGVVVCDATIDVYVSPKPKRS